MREHALKSNKQKAVCFRGATSRQAGWAKREAKGAGNGWDTLDVWWAKATEEQPASASCRGASSGQQLPGSAECKQRLGVTQQERKPPFWEGRQCLSHQVGFCFLWNVCSVLSSPRHIGSKVLITLIFIFLGPFKPYCPPTQIENECGVEDGCVSRDKKVTQIHLAWSKRYSWVLCA